MSGLMFRFTSSMAPDSSQNLYHSSAADMKAQPVSQNYKFLSDATELFHTVKSNMKTFQSDSMIRHDSRKRSGSDTYPLWGHK